MDSATEVCAAAIIEALVSIAVHFELDVGTASIFEEPVRSRRTGAAYVVLDFVVVDVNLIRLYRAGEVNPLRATIVEDRSRSTPGNKPSGYVSDCRSAFRSHLDTICLSRIAFPQDFYMLAG